MSDQANRFRSSVALDTPGMGLSSNDWTRVAESFERGERLMKGVAAGAAIEAIRSPDPRVRGAAMAAGAAAGASAWAAEEMKEFAEQKAAEAKAREEQAAADQAKAERAEDERVIREIERSGREAGERAFSREGMRDYRDPPSREAVERAGTIA